MKPFIHKSVKFASRLTVNNNYISMPNKSSELNLAVENKFCGLLHKSHRFLFHKDKKFESNLVTENDICRLEIRESSCDVSFEIDTFRLNSRRSALENDSNMARRMYKTQRTF